jgi:hypothetical protein
MKAKEKEIHEVLGIHDWIYIPSWEIRKHSQEHITPDNRRVCLICEIVELEISKDLNKWRQEKGPTSATLEFNKIAFMLARKK